MARRKKEIVIYFKSKLHKTASGYSPMGAVFPDRIVLSFNEIENYLRVVAPDKIIRKQGAILLNYPDGMIIGLSGNQVLRIENK